MDTFTWMDGMEVAVTVCDHEGIIVFMNEKSAQIFAAAGGRSLLGKNLLDCHPEPAREKIRQIMATGTSNSYTIEKNGVKKLIHQAPWFHDGEMGGLVEFSIVIPFDLPHFRRD